MTAAHRCRIPVPVFGRVWVCPECGHRWWADRWRWWAWPKEAD